MDTKLHQAMQTVMITGGTGMIGTALTRILLANGYKVIILSRQNEKAAVSDANLEMACWDIEKQQIDTVALGKADHIIHLAGAGIADKRWTKKRKLVIINSRVESSRLIAQSLEKIPNKVRTVISASATGWYGPDPQIPNNRPFVESDPSFTDFLAQTCKQWEAAISQVQQSGKRLVIIRTSPVLSKKGGMMEKLIRPMRFGIAPVLGNGKQVISWIHIDDIVNMYITAMENETMNGIYNAVSPEPVSNKIFTVELARSRKKYFIPVRVPGFLLTIMKGAVSTEVLKSCTVSCGKIKATGFTFRFPTLLSVLNDSK